MRVAAFSDLHLEFNDWMPPATSADLVVLAGDIDVIANHGNPSLWARERFPRKEIVYVLGNHEYYAYPRGMPACLHLARQQARESGVHMLEMESVVVAGMRVLGCTLWTDFALHGAVAASAAYARSGMSDFTGAIRVADGDGYRSFTPEDAIALHRRSVAWLELELEKPFEGPTVVVTHHSPHPRCEHPAYAHSRLSPAFCSDLGWLIEKYGPQLWISGHTHASHDITIGNTRLVSNQRGYSDVPEHADAPFRPTMTLEVA